MSEIGKNESPEQMGPLVEQKGKGFDFNAWQLAFELGYTIAIPIVFLALLGRFADKRLDSSPWLLLTGIVVSLFATSFLVYRKVSKFFD